MENVKIKYKKLNSKAKAPYKKHKEDAGFDLYATDIKQSLKHIEYYTGLAFEIPKGYVGLLFPRSSVTDKDLMVKNSVGVIDSSYRGEVTVRFYKTDVFYRPIEIYEKGDRVAQLVVMKLPTIEMKEAKKLSATNRNAGGYGSTGIK